MCSVDPSFFASFGDLYRDHDPYRTTIKLFVVWLAVTMAFKKSFVCMCALNARSAAWVHASKMHAQDWVHHLSKSLTIQSLSHSPVAWHLTSIWRHFPRDVHSNTVTIHPRHTRKPEHAPDTLNGYLDRASCHSKHSLQEEVWLGKNPQIRGRLRAACQNSGTMLKLNVYVVGATPSPNKGRHC